MAQTPWYKQKRPRIEYLRLGEPEEVTETKLAALDGWREIEEVKKVMWMDSRAVVAQKNKKREYLVGPLQDPMKIEPKKLTSGKFILEIEMLNLDHKGFRYTHVEDDPDVLKREFWPVVEQLIAIFFAPRLRRPAIILPQLENLRLGA